MRVLILTHGTRGDVQPFAALARALDTAGHETVLAAPASSAPLARRHGLRFAPLDDGPNRMLNDPELLHRFATTGPDARSSRTRRIATLLRIMHESKPAMARVLRDMASTARGGADLVVHQPNLPGHHIAELLGVPSVPAALQPVWVPTGAFANPILPVHHMPTALNRASYRLSTLALRSFAGITDTWRRETLRLPRRRGRHRPLHRVDGSPATLMQAFSRHILPQPVDYPAWVHTTGYWFLPAEQGWEPPRELTDFLSAGEPPVFVGFSSMPSADPDLLGRLTVQAVRRAGVRAVVASGWGGMRPTDRPEDVLFLEEVPHDWLFPRVAAVVHHGGAGTTGAALAAGRPHVVCPFHVEQSFWARCVRAAGVATAPLPARKLTTERLAKAVRQAVTSEDMAGRARELAELVRAEDGLTTAVRLLEAEVASGVSDRP